MSITTMLLTNNAYGYPTRGAQRRVKPLAVAVIHVTGNASNLGPDAALNERNYANRTGSAGPSAHYYINRDGSGIYAIEWQKFAAWSNGSFNGPDLNNTTLKAIYDQRATYNPNELSGIQIELVGNPSTGVLVTPEQIETAAQLVAQACKYWGLAPSSVLGHYHFDSVNRANCPTLVSDRTRVMGGIVSRATQLLDPCYEVKRQLAVVTAERDQARTERDQAIAERNLAINARDMAIAERDAARIERDMALAQVNTLTSENAVLNSKIISARNALA